MFVRIDNTPRDYAWGSTTAIARLLGREPGGAPEAELWLGAHPGSPARVVDPAQTGGAADLAAWIAADPATALGPAAARAAEPRLPFLLKVLAAAGPLSLQAHPSPEQAAAGFAREEAAGVPRDASHRNYKDAAHKPEMIFALSEVFDALCGFRTRAATLADLARLTAAAADAGQDPAPVSAFAARLAAASDDAAALREAVAGLLGGGDVAPLVTQTVAAAKLVLAEAGADDFEAAGALDPVLLPFATVVDLAEAYPGDPGIVLSLLLNRVRLSRGQALYLPAGNIHAYLSGLGVELMASSDNVLRGGLTPKHVDVPELLSVLDFTPLPAPLLQPETLAAGVDAYRPDVPDFELVHLLLGPDAPDGPSASPAGEEGGRAAAVTPAGPAIVLVVAGSVVVSGASGAIALERGQFAYVTPDEGSLSFTGSGEAFLATVAG